MVNINTDLLFKKAEKIAQIGHWHVNFETEEVYWSDEIYKIHGVDKQTYTPDLNSTINFYHPEDRDEVTKNIEKCIETGEDFSFELRLIRPDSEIRYVKSCGECQQDSSGQVIALFGVFQDVTEHKKREQELLEANSFLELITETIPDAIFVKDTDFRIQRANKAFLSLYPAEKRKDIIGKTTVEDYSPEDAEAFLSEDKKAFAEGYTEIQETFTFPNGKEHTFLTKKVLFHNQTKTPFLLGIARDVTPLKKAEKELIESNRRLEDFAYIASHDLKAPLRHIRMCADHIIAQYKDLIPEEAHEFFQIMDEAGKKTEEMIDTLLEYSRIERDQKLYKPLNMKDVIAGSLQHHSNKISQTKGIIQTNLDDFDEMLVIGNETLLNQCFQNLIDNALKYVHADRSPQITISAKKLNAYYEFSVTDKGIGILPEGRDKIFLMFKRLHGESSEYQGEGIGLAFCQQIIASHGGEIWLDTDYDDGACFKFTLPVLAD